MPQILSWLVPSIVTLIAVGFTYIGLKKQIKNSPKVAETHLEVLLELLENLDILREGLRYRGRFSPIIEHRCPTLSLNDGEADFSYSQRAHYFHSVGRKVIRGCRQLVFLTPENELSGMRKKAKEIKEYFLTSQPGRKNNLELMAHCILSLIAKEEQRDHSDSNECENYFSIISKYYTELDELIEKELPKLRKI